MKVIEARIKKLEDIKRTSTVINIVAIDGIVNSPAMMQGKRISQIKDSDNYMIINIVEG